ATPPQPLSNSPSEIAFSKRSGSESANLLVALASTQSGVIGDYVATYYPSTTNESQAASIEVKPGAEVPSIDIRLDKQQMFRVRGRVIDAKGQPATGVNVFIGPRN